ncbi:MAG: ribosome silencing factor [Gemmatimonadetes bacterium]|nr:ribosome silencing factor [Gemmatimonadota bacterium]
MSASLRQPDIASTRQARRAAESCMANKAGDVVLIDLRGVTDMTDYFVIATGTSDTHVRSVAENMMKELDATGMTSVAVEGLGAGRWVVIDYLDFVVHVFHPSLREYYQLERLWGDAPALALTR